MKPTLAQKIIIHLRGHVATRKIKQSGWSQPIQHYMFKCPIHGYVEDYPHGFNARLECPFCKGQSVEAKP